MFQYPEFVYYLSKIKKILHLATPVDATDTENGWIQVIIMLKMKLLIILILKRQTADYILILKIALQKTFVLKLMLLMVQYK